MSKNLSRLQIRGIEKMGDVLLPGDGELQSFSASGCVSEVDRILDYMPAKDLGDLKGLLAVMGLLPGFVVGWFLAFLERTPGWGDWAAALRFARIGIRGLVMTLYYSHPQAHRVLGYQVGVYTDDLRGGKGASQKAAVQPSVSFRATDYPAV